jgi:hypothetical protein
MGGLGAASTEPDADQRQVGHTGSQERHRQRDGQVFAGGLEARSAHGENIGRFYPVSLGQYFFRDSGLVYDSGTPSENATNPRPTAAIPALEKPAPRPVLDKWLQDTALPAGSQEDPARNRAEAERDVQLDLPRNS